MIAVHEHPIAVFFERHIPQFTDDFARIAELTETNFGVEEEPMKLKGEPALTTNEHE